MASKKPQFAYVLKMFPRFSQTFVLNEILAHEAAGAKLEIFSMRLTDDVRFHEALARVRSPVTHIKRPPAKGAALLELLHEAAAEMPDLWQIVSENPEVGPGDLQQAVMLARHVRRRGIPHLHAHFGTIATTTSRLAARLAGVSYSFTAHAKDIFHASVDEAVLGRKLADAATVITVSDFNLRYLKSHFGSAADRVVHINNGLPLDEFPYRTPERREPYILAVGRMVEKKGFAELILACKALRDAGRTFRCEIAGTGVLKGELAALIERHDLAGLVQLIGPQPQGEIRRRLHQAAVLAAPCVVAADDDRDGLPTILLEAMAMGTPCVSTDVTGIPEVLRDGETGLAVARHDTEGLAAALQRLMDDAGLRVKVAERARKQIEGEFDIEVNAGRIRSVFAGIATVGD